MSFELTDLRLFLNVAENGSITAGAKASFMALASASARVRGLEDSLGVALFSRGRRGVELTHAGRALAHHARIVLGQWERMRQEMAEYAKGLKGHVRLLCNTASLTEFLPDLLTAYLADHPNVSLDVHEKLSTEIVQDVVDGKADVGVMAGNADMGELEAYPFRRLKFVLAVPPKHPLAGRRSVSFSEALEHDFVGLAEGSPLQTYLEGHAVRLGKQVNYRVRLRGFLAVGRMVENGVGLAVLPESAAQRCKTTMDIRTIRLTDAWASRQLFICLRSLADQPAHVRELVQTLRA